MELGRSHQEILGVLLDPYASAGDLLRVSRYGREFDDLRHAGLIVYWPEGQPRPFGIVGGHTPGRWYLTSGGEACLGRQTATLRLAGSARRRRHCSTHRRAVHP